MCLSESAIRSKSENFSFTVMMLLSSPGAHFIRMSRQDFLRIQELLDGLLNRHRVARPNCLRHRETAMAGVFFLPADRPKIRVKTAPVEPVVGGQRRRRRYTIPSFTDPTRYSHFDPPGEFIFAIVEAIACISFSPKLSKIGCASLNAF